MAVIKAVTGNMSIVIYANEDINMSLINNAMSNSTVAAVTSTVDPTAIFGPQRDSLYIVIPITIIYILIFITGVFGNIFTCIVIRRNKSMHTATNYYLFSLAISDLLLLISGMPQEMYSIWSKWPYVFGHTFCVIRGLAAETSTYASVLTITLFTIERYLAICHPFVSHKMSKLSRAIKHVIILWIVSFGLALPQALQFGIKVHNGVAMCLPIRIIIEHSFEISTFVFFLAPMIIITLLYTLIGIRLNKTNMSKQKTESANNMRVINRVTRKNSTQSTKRVVKMLVAVVIAFFICWAPFHAQRLVAIYGTMENHRAKSPVLLSVYYFMTYMSGVLYYVSTCINPIFYHIMSHNFRDAFKKTWMQLCCQKTNPHVSPRCSYNTVPFTRNKSTSGSKPTGQLLKMPGVKPKMTRKESDSSYNDSQIWILCDECKKLLSPSNQSDQSSKCYHRQSSKACLETTFVVRKESS